MEEIIPLSLIISEAKHGNSTMQKRLYHRYALDMYCICLRFAKNNFDAEDILQEGFIKVFLNLDKYKGLGSFEGWVRQIITLTALNFVRKNKNNRHCMEPDRFLLDHNNNPFDRLVEKDIMRKVTQLPAGYRTVFKLFAIEGYSHSEIAEMLGCSEGNSKSQFARSRRCLEKML